jgi:transcriptional regulator of acetoin/glycerol metabolism
MEPSSGLATPPGSDPRRWSHHLRTAHDDFLSTGQVDRALRPLVVESWRRSVGHGVDPELSAPPIRLPEDRLADLRAAHPLAAAMPVIRRLLLDSATDAGLLVAVSDAAGQLLWVEGARAVLARAERVHFMAGADWSETAAGTNAPGTALALGVPVQILGAEHLARSAAEWSCSAAPIHEPDTGAVLGVLDLTGGPEVVTPQTLTLVRATVAAVEAELALERLAPRGGRTVLERGWRPPTDQAPGLRVLGQRGARLTDAGTSTTLSLRHSEILLLLAEHPGGLSAAELAVALSEEELSLVTVRAELSRLRTLLGRVRLGSRPYRLEDPLTSDVGEVRAHLEAGRVRQAVAAYPGLLLPASTAPAVEELREELHMLLRSALLASGDPDALLSFADTPHGRRDHPVWAAALAALSPRSPRYAQVAAHVARLDETLR